MMSLEAFDVLKAFCCQKGHDIVQTDLERLYRRLKYTLESTYRSLPHHIPPAAPHQIKKRRRGPRAHFYDGSGGANDRPSMADSYRVSIDTGQWLISMI